MTNQLISMWWNPFTVEHVRLIAPLSIDECRKRIKMNTFSGLTVGVDPRVPFLGRVGRNRFALVWHAQIRSGSRPIAHGTFQADAPDTTSVNIRFTVGLPVRLGLSLPLVGVAFLLVMLALAVARVPGAGDGVDIALSFLVWSVGVCALVYIGYLIGFTIVRGERLLIVTALERILQTTDTLVW